MYKAVGRKSVSISGGFPAFYKNVCTMSMHVFLYNQMPVRLKMVPYFKVIYQ